MKRYQIKWTDERPGEPKRDATVTYETQEEAETLMRYIEENDDLELVDYRIIG